jgi:hypothetical protein
MNYQSIYNQIIERAKNRQLEGYKEKHHIIPRCLDGGNNKENLVELTAREHFLCHLLLVEIHPKNNKLWYALHLMSINKNKQYVKYKVSSRMYEYIKTKRYEIKREHSEETKMKMRKPKPDGFGDNISKKLTGRKDSLETRKKKSESNKGKDGFWKGKSHSDETKSKMKKARKNVILTKERNDKISQSKKGQYHTEETKLKIKNNKLGKSTLKQKPVLQYDLEGNFIREWEKIKYACEALNKINDTSSITSCCRGKQKTAFGYIWKYK